MAQRRTVVVVLLAIALAGTGLDGFRASMKAMARCARTHGACAGVDTPDDCCRRMGHTSPASPSAVPSTRDAAPPTPILAIMPVNSIATMFVARRSLAEPLFKRPHDPPL